jgi:hypothetical protein
MGRRGWLCVALAISMCGSTLAQAAPGSSATVTGGGRLSKGKVKTDGTLTVGQQETITVTGAPPKLRLVADISPPPTATECGFSLDAGCLPEPLFRVAGTPAFKASSKGRGRLTFVMPSAYEFFSFKDPLQSHSINLVNGQTVHVEVASIRVIRRPHVKGTVTSYFANAIAVVEVPAAPSP